MRETLLYVPIQEYKNSNKILSCFPFFVFPKSDTTSGNHHEPSTLRINIQTNKQVCEGGVRGWNGEDKKSPLRNMLEPRQEFCSLQQTEDRELKTVIGAGYIKLCQYGWYFGQCMKVNADESQSKLSRYEQNIKVIR